MPIKNNPWPPPIDVRALTLPQVCSSSQDLSWLSEEALNTLKGRCYLWVASNINLLQMNLRCCIYCKWIYPVIINEMWITLAASLLADNIWASLAGHYGPSLGHLSLEVTKASLLQKILTNYDDHAQKLPVICIDYHNGLVIRNPFYKAWAFRVVT